MFFTKPTNEEIFLPFTFIDVPEDSESGLINIEAYGNIYGRVKYCYACYELKDSKMYRNGDFESLVEKLKNSAEKTVKVILKVKKGVPKDFKIDIESLAEAYNDERFKMLSLLGWGLNDKSYKELSKKP